MKQFKTMLAGLFLISATACSSTYHAGTTANDDVYYSSKDKTNTPVTDQPQAAPSDYSLPQQQDYYQPENNAAQNNDSYNQNTQGSDYSQERTVDNEGNTIINNYYDTDDYYDYAYSSNLRRFYTPANGYGYYDSYYTNSYWYDHNPLNWGVSIYFGYNWWAPSSWYSSPFCYGGYSSWYRPYNSWYNPYYGGGYNHGYNHGYNQGYWNGYNDGYANNGYYGNYQPYYYNSLESTSYYYGPRGNVASNSDVIATRPPRTLATLYDESALGGKTKPVNNGLSGIENNNATINVRPVKDEITKPIGIISDKNQIGTGSKPLVGNVEDVNNSKPTLGGKPKQAIKDNNTNVTEPVDNGIKQPTNSGLGTKPKTNIGDVKQSENNNNENAGRPNYSTKPQNNDKQLNEPQIKNPVNNNGKPQQGNSPFQRPKSQFGEQKNDNNGMAKPSNPLNNQPQQNGKPQYNKPREQPQYSQPRNETPAYQKPREQQAEPNKESRNNWFNQQPRQQEQQTQPKTQQRQETPKYQAPQRQQTAPAPAPRNNDSKNNGGGRPKR